MGGVIDAITPVSGSNFVLAGCVFKTILARQITFDPLSNMNFFLIYSSITFGRSCLSENLPISSKLLILINISEFTEQVVISSLTFVILIIYKPSLFSYYYNFKLIYFIDHFKALIF